MFEELIKNNLIWFPEKNMGYYSIDGFPYDENYFQKYIDYAETDKGQKITQSRIDFVNKYYSGIIIDIGIGSGDFVSKRSVTLGYDICKTGVKWLKEKELFVDVYEQNKLQCLTFWDSLEHIKNPEILIEKVEQFIFISIPIFTSYQHVINSRHYRKNEHYWYFTDEGLVNWMDSKDFELIKTEDFEIKLGREDIKSYAFKRKNNG